MILQAVNDVAAGSDERLVLVDLEIHFHPLSSGLLVPPSTSRKVMKMLPTLHHSQVLLLLGLRDYCELQTDRYLVHKDNELWPAHGRSAHDLNVALICALKALCSNFSKDHASSKLRHMSVPVIDWRDNPCSSRAPSTASKSSIC